MKLEISYRKKNGKHKHVEAKEHATKKEQVDEEIKEEIRKYFEKNKNGKTAFQNLWYTAKAVLREKFITIQSYLKKHKNSDLKRHQILEL